MTNPPNQGKDPFPSKDVAVPLGMDRDELRELAWGYYLQAQRHLFDYEAVSQRENALKAKLHALETPAVVSVDEFVRYRSCLYRANGRLIQMGQEPEKLDYTDKSAPETDALPEAHGTLVDRLMMAAESILTSEYSKADESWMTAPIRRLRNALNDLQVARANIHETGVTLSATLKAKGLPDFAEVMRLSPEVLRERYWTQREWFRGYAHCLDGLLGPGSDYSGLLPQDIRRAFEKRADVSTSPTPCPVCQQPANPSGYCSEACLHKHALKAAAEPPDILAKLQRADNLMQSGSPWTDIETARSLVREAANALRPAQKASETQSWICPNCKSENRDDYHRISCPGCGVLRPPTSQNGSEQHD